MILNPIFLKSGEREVLYGIMEGLTGKRIAQKLNVSYACVADRKRRLFDRFEVRNTKELIVAYNNYLIKIREIEQIRQKLSGGINANSL